MSRQCFQAVAIVVALFATSSLAYQGKGHGRGNLHNPASQRYDRDDGRWERRGDYEYRIYDRDEGLPPAWNKGKKTGWGNCGLPPGQAKKYGCPSYRYGGRDYYYYRDDHGRWSFGDPVFTSMAESMFTKVTRSRKSS
jgi:hypothetical protein